LQQVTRKTQEYVLSNYGNLLSTDEPVFDEKEKLWKVNLRTDYPRLIKNDSPEERYVRTLVIKDLGAIWLNEKFSVVKNKSTSRVDTIKTLRVRLRTWEERAESIIVKSSALQLANTGIANVFLNRIKTILGNFLQEDDVIISFEELDSVGNNYLKWMRLLEDLQLVRETKQGYTHGNMFTELLRQTNRRSQNTIHDFLTNVLAYVIRERYPVLREAFKLRQFETLVHLDSCYYRPALEARKIIYQRADSLFHRYMTQYGRYKSTLELRASLLELVNSNALCRKKRYYFANEELFEDMLRQSEESLSITSPRL
jgi:hypothetical protein